jgi:histone acetyltransferase (RNA polymerase elongator complex component)
MSQKVLDASRRGHTVEDSEKACCLIKEYGFNLTGQMMIGLPGSYIEDEIFTAKRICELGCDSARIYPTVVFYGTELCSMAQNSIYTPLSLDEAVVRSAKVYKIFRDNNVDVLRIGLQSSDELSDESKVYAGANHPSLGELVIGEYRYSLLSNRTDKIKDILLCAKEPVRLWIFCAKGEISKFCGQNKKNKTKLLEHLKNYGVTEIKFKESDYLCKEKTLFCTENIQTKRTRRKQNCI